MGRARGYNLVWVELHLDAFLVREDLICEGTAPALESFRSVTGLPQRFHMNEKSEKFWMEKNWEAPPSPEGDYCKAGVPCKARQQAAHERDSHSKAGFRTLSAIGKTYDNFVGSSKDLMDKLQGKSKTKKEALEKAVPEKE